MSNKRVTIYDIAKALGFSASYVSKALNNHPTINDKRKEVIKKKAVELNYKHNSHAANLRHGLSKIIGVVVPHINQSFFSEVIAGIEEICFKNNHSLVICQSHESFENECTAIDTLIHQNVDCILISIAADTQSFAHLEAIKRNNIKLIQFDRCLNHVESDKVLNDNKDVSYNVVKTLVKEGYKKIAFLGGPQHLAAFKDRKAGYLKAIKEESLIIPYNYIVEDALSGEEAKTIAKELLQLTEPPDAFFCVSDHQSLAVFQIARSLGIKVPDQLGIVGFANEVFTELIDPALSSVDQKSKELGKAAAGIYFESHLGMKRESEDYIEKIIASEIIIRESILRNSTINAIKHKH